ncbi:MAG: C39 family peptidase [Candidatus Falkowbacteria bacterium]|nr:C39 family peptidase [Candidatus Falkowbacteria bacterium]
MKKILIAVGVLLIIGISAFFLRGNIRDVTLELEKRQLPTEVKDVTVKDAATPSVNAATPSVNVATPSVNVATPSPTAAANKFAGLNLAVPFSAQAPYGDWSLPYAEACEEASALLVDRFYTGAELTPEIVKQEILKIVDWENKTFGYYEHTTAKETGRILKEYFNYKRVDVNYDISLADIKAQIMAGRPVIVPLAGRLIGNPYYRQPGPIYHMLVIKGLTKDGDFITNDVGTKRGNNYVYDANVLYDAIHDAPYGGGELNDIGLEKDIPTGRKAIIVVYPN